MRSRRSAALCLTIATVAAGCGEAAPARRAASPTSAPDRGAETTYRDGRYEAKGWYGGLPSNIDVALTLRDGRVAGVRVTPNATNPTSLGLQRRFAEAVPEVVVGKRLDEVRVSRLAGSSSTPDGFNQAIERIKEQASR
jgi:uncharacterized protein with FMN-binding domain